MHHATFPHAVRAVRADEFGGLVIIVAVVGALDRDSDECRRISNLTQIHDCLGTVHRHSAMG